MARDEVGRPIKVEGMVYAPTNEQGVVFLFGRLASRLGFTVEIVRTGFPDCIARRRGKTCRIEFKYRASQYNYPPHGADVVVCWENDWEHRPKKYKHLEIIDLKKHVGASPRIFAVGCDETTSYAEYADTHALINWTVPARAQKDDLILMYRTAPSSEIRDICTVTGPFSKSQKWGRLARLHRIIRLKTPLTPGQLKADPRTRDLSVVRANFKGKRDITDHWMMLCNKIIELNASSKRVLRRYYPD